LSSHSIAVSPWPIFLIIAGPFVIFLAWVFFDIARSRRSENTGVREAHPGLSLFAQRHANVVGLLFLGVYAILLFGGWVHRGSIFEAVMLTAAAIAYVFLSTGRAIRDATGEEVRQIREARLVLLMLIAFGVLLGTPGIIAAVRHM
jgi:hypothetical protein